MDCKDAQERLERDQDGALDAPARRTLHAHLAGCEVCSAAGQQLRAMRSAIRDRASYFTAPQSLRQRIGRAMKGHQKPAAHTVVLPWWGFSSSLAVTAVLAVAITLAIGLPEREDEIGKQVVASHLRSLMETHLADVASSDQHTVKPWFSGKLDYSPPVHDLAAEGFPLIGGRLDYVSGRPVAALVYQRRQHRINVFVWPAVERTSAASRSITLNGYNALEWTQAGMNFWAVSDLSLAELGMLQDLLDRKERSG